MDMKEKLEKDGLEFKKYLYELCLEMVKHHNNLTELKNTEFSEDEVIREIYEFNNKFGGEFKELRTKINQDCKKIKNKLNCKNTAFDIKSEAKNFILRKVYNVSVTLIDGMSIYNTQTNDRVYDILINNHNSKSFDFYGNCLIMAMSDEYWITNKRQLDSLNGFFHIPRTEFDKLTIIHLAKLNSLNESSVKIINSNISFKSIKGDIVKKINAKKQTNNKSIDKLNSYETKIDTQFNENDFLAEIEQLISEDEYRLFYKLVVEGVNINELAQDYKVNTNSITQRKRRILKKIKKALS